MLGPSGSGKSTLALGLAGLLGRDVPGTVSGIAGVWQRRSRPRLPGRRSAAGHGARRRRRRLRSRVARLAAGRACGVACPRPWTTSGWPIVRRAVVATLSGGQRQRLALAGALAPDPAMLVLDEPTANLDPAAAAAFISRLAALKARGTATMVIVEHRVDDVWPLADRLLVLGRDGRPLAMRRPDEVVARPGGRADRGRGLAAELARAGAGRERRVVSPMRDGGSPPTSAARTARRCARPGLRLSRLAARPARPRPRRSRPASGSPSSAPTAAASRRWHGCWSAWCGRDAGQVAIGGVAPHGRPPAERAALAGLVFQDPELGFLATTVDDEVRLGLPATPDAGVGRGHADGRARPAARDVRAAHALPACPAASSAGCRWRRHSSVSRGCSSSTSPPSPRTGTAWSRSSTLLRARADDGHGHRRGLARRALRGRLRAARPGAGRRHGCTNGARRDRHRAQRTTREPRRSSGRTSALVKLLVAVTWLLGVVVTPDPRASLVLGLVALLAAAALGSVPLPVILRAWRRSPSPPSASPSSRPSSPPATDDPAPSPRSRSVRWSISVAGVEAGLLVGRPAARHRGHQHRLRDDDQPDRPRRRLVQQAARLRPLRLRRAGRLRRLAAPGARPARAAGGARRCAACAPTSIRGCWSRCWCWPSGTRSGWAWRWTRAASARADAAPIDRWPGARATCWWASGGIALLARRRRADADSSDRPASMRR